MNCFAVHRLNDSREEHFCGRTLWYMLSNHESKQWLPSLCMETGQHRHLTLTAAPCVDSFMEREPTGLRVIEVLSRVAPQLRGTPTQLGAGEAPGSLPSKYSSSLLSISLVTSSHWQFLSSCLQQFVWKTRRPVIQCDAIALFCWSPDIFFSF